MSSVLVLSAIQLNGRVTAQPLSAAGTIPTKPLLPPRGAARGVPPPALLELPPA